MRSTLGLAMAVGLASVFGGLSSRTTPMRRPAGRSFLAAASFLLASRALRGPGELAPTRTRAPPNKAFRPSPPSSRSPSPSASGWQAGAAGLQDVDGVQTFLVIGTSIAVEALPFVLLGALVSAAIEVFVPERWFERIARLPLPLQIPGVALAGMAMPVCECGSVPVARRLIVRGVHPAAGIAFMLAAPIINPIVLLSTAVAYQGRGALEMVIGRAALGLLRRARGRALIGEEGVGRLVGNARTPTTTTTTGAGCAPGVRRPPGRRLPAHGQVHRARRGAGGGDADDRPAERVHRRR